MASSAQQMRAYRGPAVLSVGFRPFFLGGAVWAIAAMLLWIAALIGKLDFAWIYGVSHWHAHEMLFGYASAILAGFLLTTVPNWTGRLPVAGWPLFFLFALWAAGRLALLASDAVGVGVAVGLDMLFLPALLFICMREVVAGHDDVPVRQGEGGRRHAALRDAGGDRRRALPARQPHHRSGAHGRLAGRRLPHRPAGARHQDPQPARVTEGETTR